MREIVMPKSSMTMTEGELTKWLRSDGEIVAEGDVVAEILTDKVEMEVEAPSNGRLGILVGEGSTVAVGTPIAVVLAEGETAPDRRAAAADTAAEQQTAAGGAAPPGATPSPSRPSEAGPSSPPGEASGPSGAGPSGDGTSGRLRATPAARAMARRVGVDLSGVRGTGPRGRIKSDDVASAAQTEKRVSAQPSWLPNVRSRERPRGIRGAMARHMSAASSIPQFTLFVDVALGAADEARRDRAETSLTDMIVHAVARALRDHTELNAHYLDGEILQFESIHVGLAIDTPGGLVVPVIRDADRDLRAVAAQRKELAQAARIGRLRPEEIEGATFTVSNLGTFEIDVFQPVIDPPRVGILSVGRMRGDAGRTATLGLAADHRAVDGAQAARFLQTVTRLLERPDRYLL